jgi:carbon storage regulator CsrA
MLVLSRNKREKIVFPSLQVTVEILQISGKTVRLGIDAPTRIPVHREEVAERIRKDIRHDNPE